MFIKWCPNERLLCGCHSLTYSFKYISFESILFLIFHLCLRKLFLASHLCFSNYLRFICFILCVYIAYIYICLSTFVFGYLVCAQGSQKRVSDPLELKLQAAVSHHTGPRNWVWSSVKPQILITTESSPQPFFLCIYEQEKSTDQMVLLAISTNAMII